MQLVMTRLRTDVDSHKFIWRSARDRATTVYQIRSCSSGQILDEVGEEGCQSDRDENAQVADLMLVGGRPGY